MFLNSIGRVFRREFSLIFSDMGAMIFFFALPLLYPIVYTLIYYPQVATDLPVAVVDHSRSEASRSLVRIASAAPAISIYAQCANMQEAKDLYGRNEVVAVMEIPADYAAKIGRGEQAVVPVYFEMSLLLRYRALLSALSDIQLKVASDVTSARIEALGAETAGLGGGLPVQANATFLGNPGQGFASFIMPGVFMLILQQSMVLGICLLAGTANERRRRNRGFDPMAVEASPLADIWGKALCYVVLYIPATIYMVHILPEIFSLPHTEAVAPYVLFILPYLLASAMFGMLVAGACTERESAFMVVVFTSLIFLFLSGLTWPRYAMPPFWKTLSDLIPATWGVEGFIRINSNGATLAESARPFWWLWGLAAAYFAIVLGVKIYENRQLKPQIQK